MFTHERNPECSYFENMSERCSMGSDRIMNCETLRRLMRKCGSSPTEEVERITTHDTEPTRSSDQPHSSTDYYPSPRTESFNNDEFRSEMNQIGSLFRGMEEMFHIFGSGDVFSHHENRTHSPHFQHDNPPPHQTYRTRRSNRQPDADAEEERYQEFRRQNYNSVDV